MTSPKGTGKIINIKCTEVSLPEFPNLLLELILMVAEFLMLHIISNLKTPTIN